MRGRKWWRWRPDLSPLRERAARRLVGSEFASLIGDGMVLTAIPFAVDSIGGGALEISVALAAQGTGLAGMVLLGGVVGDRFPRRSVMVGADVLRFVPQAMIAVLLLAGEASFWQLVVAQVVHGIGTGLYMPASWAIVPDAVAERSIQPTNALKAVGRAFASAGGPALGAGACLVVGPGLAMGADAATFAISAALLAGIPARSPERARTKGWWDELKEGWDEFRAPARRWMQSVTVQFTAVNALVLAPFYVFAPVTAQESLGGVKGWAFLLCVLAIGETAGGLLATRWRPDRPLVVATAVFAIWAVPLLLLAALAPLPLIGVALVAAGFGQAVFAVLYETTVQTHVGDSERSRLSSFEMFGSLAFVPFGFVIGGAVNETIGAGPGLVGGAVVLLVSAALVLCVPSVRQLRAINFDERRR